jgi:hypothetical protein
MDQFYSDIDATGPSVTHLCGEEDRSGSVKLKICGRKLLIAISGEPPGHLLLEQFQEGLARKLLLPSMQTLVDMTRFIGVVDWQALTKLRELAPWGKDNGPAPRTAYLLRENSAALLIKATAALFPASEHQAFTEQAAAIAWLES